MEEEAYPVCHMMLLILQLIYLTVFLPIFLRWCDLKKAKITIPSIN